MNPNIPRVAAIHDISCFGRCSLTVIMPILSCMGIQVCPLPTAVLSTHLGGFSDVAIRDFTDLIPEFAGHWQKEGIYFDCLYSGFLASEHQIDLVSGFFDTFNNKSSLVVVDPVMGDEGKLYSVYTPQLQEQMKGLICKADVITPNYTEACFLLGEKYREVVTDVAEIKRWLERLIDMGPHMAVITGIPLAAGKILNLGYERDTKRFCKNINDHIPVKYPGTGDIFASVLVGALLRHYSLPKAMSMATDFVTLGVKATFKAGTPAREGILLERVLPWLSNES